MGVLGDDYIVQLCQCNIMFEKESISSIKD